MSFEYQYRYDARGYLNDINQYVSNKNDSKNLNSEEIEFEAQLNLERFKDLSYDEVEQEVKGLCCIIKFAQTYNNNFVLFIR